MSILCSVALLVVSCSKQKEAIPVEEESRALEQPSGDVVQNLDDYEIPSSRPLDSGEPFRLGYGYDNLSGERHLSCLDQNFTVADRVVSTSDSDFSVLQSKEDLAKKLNIEINAEASGSYGLFRARHLPKPKYSSRLT